MLLESLQDCYKVPAGGPHFQVKITEMSSRLLKYIPEQTGYLFHRCIMSPLKVLGNLYVTRKHLSHHRLLVCLIDRLKLGETEEENDNDSDSTWIMPEKIKTGVASLKEGSRKERVNSSNYELLIRNVCFAIVFCFSFFSS